MQPVARTVLIAAPLETVWSVMADVAGWPRWARYMRHLQQVDGRPFGLGSRVEVAPKGLPRAVWTVTAYTPPRRFTWTTVVLPGLSLEGGHVLRATARGTAATFSPGATGPLAVPLTPLLQVVFRRNTRLATDGLRRFCEALR
jgi:uncharacterized protein YndB with AHSA1/START domain